jgi:dTDP-4-dehydrorhamnose reductase
VRREVHALEIWGGIECSLNRVGDRFTSQLELNGHVRRIDDLDRIAALGIRTLRYPALWEMLAPVDGAPPAWDWIEPRLLRLRALGIQPILGLLHHGSGPAHTGLLDPAFPRKFAGFARAVAERFPWIDAYTPVNEPLTTARFSALYGLWYPHHRDDASFVRACVNQCHAIALAMGAIREVNPRARLIQTEDLGKVYSSASLRQQADFENERRWLTWDLLVGRVDESHRLRGYLRDNGVADAELDGFLAHPCPPDVIGINHYVTSERFLHDEPLRFPAATRGGNGIRSYADVEAVRVLSDRDGLAPLLAEAWHRYGLPIAITETHLGCSREEQLRWLNETWTVALEARDAGVDVRAVTAWALLGSFDWNSLLTRFAGCYEPGALDVRGAAPRPTAIAELIKAFAADATAPELPALDGAGWWHRPSRLTYGIEERREAIPRFQTRRRIGARRPILVTGATGTLGTAFGRICEARELACRLCSRGEVDIASAWSVERMLEALRPWAVVNAAGYVRVDDAEADPECCHRENVGGPETLARACARLGLPLVTYSTDLVFDGLLRRPYVETDSIAPLNVYGESKARAEQRVLELHPEALVIRTSAFFGPWDVSNFLTDSLRRMASGMEAIAADDMTISPTYVPDLVSATLDLLIDRAFGVWHCANEGSLTWAEFAREASSRAGIPSTHLRTRSSATTPGRARRPLYSSLRSNRGLTLPSLSDAIDRYLALVSFDSGFMNG